MQETCCPQYTIRLDATNFKPSKSQRHVLNRIKRYLDMDAGNSKSQAEDAKPSKTAGHGSKGNANDAGVANSHGTSRNGVPSGKAAGEDSTRNRKGKGRADDGRKDVSGGLVTLSKQVTYAAAAALANSVALSAITLEPGWESNLEKWTQVRIISWGNFTLSEANGSRQFRWTHGPHRSILRYCEDYLKLSNRSRVAYRQGTPLTYIDTMCHSGFRYLAVIV